MGTLLYLLPVLGMWQATPVPFSISASDLGFTLAIADVLKVVGVILGLFSPLIIFDIGVNKGRMIKGMFKRG